MKRFVLEFIGGDWDGRQLDSESTDHDEKLLSQVYYFKTQDGTVGKGFNQFSEQALAFAQKRGWMEPDAPSKGHDYKVIERRDEGDRTRLRLKHASRG
ncbi:MAG: hypothetical protein HUU20_13140 [Pirellulales bacterium]|nr:hypothetical protein [Pirellulales bacterium]